VVVGYLAISICCFLIPVGWLTAGNPFLAGIRLYRERTDDSGADHLFWMLIEYGTIHGLFILFCYFPTRANLRVQYEKEDERLPILEVQPDPSVVRETPAMAAGDEAEAWEEQMHLGRYRARFARQADDAPPKPRPPVRDNALLWKERYAEPLVRVGPAGQAIGVAFLIMGVLLASYLILLGLAAAASSGDVRGFTGFLAQYVGMGMACLMLLGVGLRAAGTVTTERDRQTLDGLLTSDLDNRTMLNAKWLGSIMAVWSCCPLPGWLTRLLSRGWASFIRCLAGPRC
jgi:hypothetical protein